MPTIGRPRKRTRTGRKARLETSSLAKMLAIMEMSEASSPTAYHLQRLPFIQLHFDWQYLIVSLPIQLS
ncbi:hypothetical protein AOA80_05175 [Methanomassiliicoccales archaeon RumEn M1]|nr:hypothetical protein AOA80_05175 [Methanomassiliicoccales archaeon RumEn M1]